MQSALVLALVVVTALSAFFDAKGFVYAALAWRGGSISTTNALWSLGFFVSLGVAWLLISAPQ